MLRSLALREPCTYVDSIYDLYSDAKLTQIAVAGERIWDGRHTLFNRRKNILSDQRALQQLPRPDTLSSASQCYRQLRPI